MPFMHTNRRVWFPALLAGIALVACWGVVESLPVRSTSTDEQGDSADAQALEAGRKSEQESFERLEKALVDSEDRSVRSMRRLFAEQEALLVSLARQPRPQPGPSPIELEFQYQLMEFVKNPRNRAVYTYDVATAFCRLGQLLFLQGNNRDAYAAMNEATVMAERLRDPALSGISKNTLGCILSALGKNVEAMGKFTSSVAELEEVSEQTAAQAIALRNLGLARRKVGENGIDAILKSIGLLEQSPMAGEIGVEYELLIDTRMVLCEMLWSQGDIRAATAVCEQVKKDVGALVSASQETEMGKLFVSRNRYLYAYRLVNRNLEWLKESETQVGMDTGWQDQGDFVGNWQWRPLLNLKTELVSTDGSVKSKMTAEFAHQSGFAVPWGQFEWTHSVVLEIAKWIQPRAKLVVITDDEESLLEARTSFSRAGLKVDAIEFAISDIETPWFRDQGPIVGVGPGGQTIWFDSALTRPDKHDRLVLDELPQTLSKNWRTRVAKTPLHVEGGMLLSNGAGLAVGARAILDENRNYGFTDDLIDRELRRITGAERIVLVETLANEGTHHVDLFMTFTGQHSVVVGQYKDAANSNADRLDRIAATLADVEVAGEKIQVRRIPMVPCDDGVIRSYTNVIFANGVLLVPSYPGLGDHLEEEVKDFYQQLMPEWKIQFIDCGRLCVKGGVLHCLVSNLGGAEFLPRLPNES
jgi:agmatine/peptidylarginine deiminase